MDPVLRGVRYGFAGQAAVGFALSLTLLFLGAAPEMKLNELTPILTTYIVLALTRWPRKKFPLALGSVAGSAILWGVSLAGWPVEVAAVLVAIAGLVGELATSPERVWVWTKVPEHGRETELDEQEEKARHAR